MPDPKRDQQRKDPQNPRRDDREEKDRRNEPRRDDQREDKFNPQRNK